MRDEESKLISKSLFSVMPYVTHPEELKELIQTTNNECSCIGEFVESFKRKNSEISDPAKKTDGQIFLNELEHILAKSCSD